MEGRAGWTFRRVSRQEAMRRLIVGTGELWERRAGLVRSVPCGAARPPIVGGCGMGHGYGVLRRSKPYAINRRDIVGGGGAER